MTLSKPARSLDVNIAVAQRGVQLAFQVPAGSTMALLGPNGSGKTTTLAALAGWLIPDTGFARLDDTVLFDCPDPLRKPRRWVPAHRRNIGYVSQQPRLFPHLTAQQNIRYGMPRAGITGRAHRRQAAEEWLARVGLEGLGHRLPHELSGGQAQRVALARVLASEPDLVLLDEPLAALDIQAAPAMRSLLNEVLADRTTVLVTHHQSDVDALADQVHRLEPAGQTS